MTGPRDLALMLLGIAMACGGAASVLCLISDGGQLCERAVRRWRAKRARRRLRRDLMPRPSADMRDSLAEFRRTINKR